METTKERINAFGIRFSVEEHGKEIGRAFFYVLNNNLHDEPFGLMEDVFVEEDFRDRGVGRKLVTDVIKEARRQKCYKLICTSRYSNEWIHNLYEELGFINHGKEFRLDFDK